MKKLILITLSILFILLLKLEIANAAGFIYVANHDDNTVSVIDAVTLRITTSINLLPGSAPNGISATPNGRKVFVPKANPNPNLPGIVSVINTSDNSIVSNIPVGAFPLGIAISPDGRKAYVVNTVSNSITIIDAITNAVLETIDHVGNSPRGIAISPNGQKAYIADNRNNALIIMDISTHGMTSINVGNYPQGVAVSPSGEKVYVTNANSNTVSVIDTNTNGVTSIDVGSLPMDVAISPNGTKAYVVNHLGRNFSIIDTATNGVSGPVIVGERPIAVAFSLNGEKAYIANGQDNTISVIDVMTNMPSGAPISVGQSPTGIAYANVPPPPPVPVCGNGIIESGEQCDPPNRTTCDGDCKKIPPQCKTKPWLPVCGGGRN